MNPGPPSESASNVAAETARRSYGKLLALLVARAGDVCAAEDALSDAFAAALADWSTKGIPTNPEGWILTVARRKRVDAERRAGRITDASDDILQNLASDLDAAAESEEIPDQRLGLLLACAHPTLDASIHAPLMLQVVLGLDAKAISSAFLTSPAAMGKRLVRAKTILREGKVPFRIPPVEELESRLPALLDAIYGAFTEGWSVPGGTDVARRDLAAEALHLARLIVQLLPDQAEPQGLLALMLHAEARRRSRRNAGGEYVPLDEQDTSLWDWPLILEAESLLQRASSLGTVGRYRIGRYQLEGALQSAHVYRRHTGKRNWADVVRLYDALLALSPSPVGTINRALALAELRGPEVGLEAMEGLSRDARISTYQPYWAARAELLSRAGRSGPALEAYDLAIGLERDPAVRRFLQQRRSRLI